MDFAHELHTLANHIEKKSRAVLREKGTKEPWTRLRVEFKDGRVYDEPRAVHTFIETLQRFGLENVARLTSVRCCGYPVVAKHKNTNVPDNKTRLVDGHYVWINSSNEAKQRQLLIIAEQLGWDIAVEIIKETE